MNRYDLPLLFKKINSFCAVNNISVQSVYDTCHGMTLQELVYYLLGVIRNTLETLKDIPQDFEDLKDFVENYFNNLDVQKEINNKLDQMFEEGLFDDIINGHLTSGYINVVSAGAKNDGSTPTGAILNGIFNAHPNATFYFPPGTYVIETPLELYNDNIWALLFDGATLKASTNISSVIHVSTKTSTNEAHPPKIYGTGTVDMNNVASIGIMVENQSRYLKIYDINIENIGNGIGIQLGGGDGASMSTILENICVRGSASSNLNSIGVLVYGYDVYFVNVNIIRCFGGIRLMSGGNMLSNVHIWSDLDVSNANWSSSYGIYNSFIDNMFNNIYLDNVGVGIWCIQPTICTNIYYYLPIAGTGANVGVVFRTSQNNVVKCNGLYVVKKSGFTINPILIANRTQEYLVGSTCSFILQTNINSVDGFTAINEAFNIKNNKFAKTLAKYNQASVNDDNMYLVGYLSKTTGVGHLKLTYGGAFSYDILIDSERVNDLTSSNLKATLVAGASSSGKEKLHIGSAVDMGELTCYPVYMEFANGFEGILGVDFDSVGELNFYLNAHLNISECAYNEPISSIVSIEL